MDISKISKYIQVYGIMNSIIDLFVYLVRRLYLWIFGSFLTVEDRDDRFGHFMISIFFLFVLISIFTAIWPREMEYEPRMFFGLILLLIIIFLKPTHLALRKLAAIFRDLSLRWNRMSNKSKDEERDFSHLEEGYDIVSDEDRMLDQANARKSR